MEATANLDIGYLIGAIAASAAWISFLSVGFFIGIVSGIGALAGLAGERLTEKVMGAVSLLVMSGCIGLFWWTAYLIIGLWRVAIGG